MIHRRPIAHIVSDIHLTEDKNEFYRSGTGQSVFELLAPEEQDEVSTLILPGDLAPIEYLVDQYKKQTEFWAELVNWLHQYEKVIYVAGNHEYYTTRSMSAQMTMDVLDQMLRNILPDHVRYVGRKNETVIIGRYVFLCSTLWANGSPYPQEKEAIVSSLNDFLAIPHFSYDKMREAFNENVRWIRDELQHFADSQTYNQLEGFPVNLAVITHHAPSLKSVHTRYRKSPINGAFASDLDDMIREYPFIDYWVHGHTHDSFHYEINKTEVICNPMGYINWNGTIENESFEPFKTILI